VVDSLAQANRILEQLKRGEEFASLATEWSIDPTANDGGYLGIVDPATMRPELRDALQGVGRGQVSPVFKLPEGYAILMVDRQDRPTLPRENPTATLALTGPGAVHYGPDIGGFGEAFALFYQATDKPKDWDHVLNPVTAAEFAATHSPVE